jgi:hypothetical protein
MKGTSFQKPLEFNLQVEGESWHQGDKIQGSLMIKNHGGGNLAGISVHLASGELKKVRFKDPEAFTLLASAELTVAAEGTPLPWSFQLERNAPVTDGSKSLFLLYGQGNETPKLGQLQLSILPFWQIEEFLKVLAISFKFVTKSHKVVKDGLEVKLSPPQSRSFAAVELAVLVFRFEGENLEVSYTFQVKKLEASAGAIDMKKEKKAFKKVYTLSQLQTSSGRFNHEAMEPAIGEVISSVESKGFA